MDHAARTFNRTQNRRPPFRDLDGGTMDFGADGPVDLAAHVNGELLDVVVDGILILGHVEARRAVAAADLVT
jgi:hypothetical protein